MPEFWRKCISCRAGLVSVFAGRRRIRQISFEMLGKDRQRDICLILFYIIEIKKIVFYNEEPFVNNSVHMHQGKEKTGGTCDGTSITGID